MSGNFCDVGLIDTNHNVKNNRYQMIGGSCAAIIGGYVYGIWILQSVGVTRELWQPEDFLYYLLVLKLNSHTTIQKIIAVEMNDVGDAAVTHVSFYMARIHAYDVNVKYLPWGEHLIYHWTTTLWFTSFYKPAKTVCTNQRNMVTESIEVAFLFPISDVQNPRGTTTDPCEHTFGGLRRYER